MNESVRFTMAASLGKVFRIIMGRNGWAEESIFCGNLWLFRHMNVAGILIRLAAPDSSIFHLRQPADMSGILRHLNLPFLPFHGSSQDFGYLSNHLGLTNNHGL